MTDDGRRWDLALTQIAQLGEPAGAPGNVAVMLEQLCKAAVTRLGAAGVGVSVMADRGISGFAAASDLPSRELEELQFTLGEGPCVDAFSAGYPVLVPDLSDGVQRRWPMYVAAALERGVGAIFAFPIQVGGSRLGVLDVSRDSPGSMTSQQVGRAVAHRFCTILDSQSHVSSSDAITDGRSRRNFVTRICPRHVAAAF